ncbi:MAG: phytanoyl-CoA dioxygenase family protein [Candidatus Latescibacterota bacterium]|nr:phytanoyl-CoA dioxygenase family protein [Candidatus Latescibacterota bacterium]
MSDPHRLHIDDTDVAFYREQGYFIYQHSLFPEDRFRALQSFFEKLLAELPEGKRPESMDVPHFNHPELFDWLLADEVLDFVERFIGSDIALWASHFICKPPKTGQRVPWHEDSAYWGERLSEHEVLTIWLAIDDSNRENGCMRAVAGSHDNGFSDYEDVANPEVHVFGNEIVAEQVDESRIVDLEVKAGQCHIHHSRIVHGSQRNTSGRRRCGYTMRYMPTRVKMIQAPGRPRHQIYLARGQDLGGNEYGEPGVFFDRGV